MSELILDSLEIQNFRIFKHLVIEKLGRVNLIVGKNNVGKTALLEAVLLYAYRGFPAMAARLLEIRDESIYEGTRVGSLAWHLSIGHLFNGRPSIQTHPLNLKIAPVGTQKKTLDFCFTMMDDKSASHTRKIPSLTVQWNDLVEAYDLSADLTFLQPLGEAVKSLLLFSNGTGNNELAELWDEVVLDGKEEEVLFSLRILTPSVKRLNFVAGERQPIYHPKLIGIESSSYSKGEKERIPVVRISNAEQTVPLRSMGDGLTKMLEIALALTLCKDGIALIDEIDTGLHYSVQADMWQLVFETAAKLNVQVFATTHSWDCIEAFQQAAVEHQEEGMLISLRQKQHEEGIAAVLFDEQDLVSVARAHVEVR